MVRNKYVAALYFIEFLEFFLLIVNLSAPRALDCCGLRVGGVFPLYGLRYLVVR